MKRRITEPPGGGSRWNIGEVAGSIFACGSGFAGSSTQISSSIASKPAEYPLTFRWDFLVAAGSLVLYAGILAFLVMVAAGRLRPGDIFKVYGRTGEPCERCGTPLEKIRVAGRGTWYCPSCQVPPGGRAQAASSSSRRPSRSS